jgi:predicted component of type VI protein secretion system
MPRVSITIPGKNSQPYRFQLDRKKVSIGRSSDNDIIINCPSVSSLHCTMERMNGGYILRDRNSTNGLKLGEDEMAVIDLRNESEVRVGDVKFDYTLSDEELDDLDQEGRRSSRQTRDREKAKEEAESQRPHDSGAPGNSGPTRAGI